MAAHLNSVSSNLPLPAERVANRLLAGLIAFGVSLLLLLLIVVAMFAETLVPHVIEFCLLAWQTMSIDFAYRLMFLGLIVLTLTEIAFLVRLWWHARLTERHVQKLLLKKGQPTPKLASILHELGLSSRVDFVALPQPFALCYGWRAPRVLVTTGLTESLDEIELRGVLAHEKYHLMQHDPLKILIARALRDAIIFFPVLNDLLENYLLLQEIAADQTAVDAGATRAALASALIKVFRSPVWDTLGVGAYTTFGERVEHLANPQRRFVWRFSWVRAGISVVAGILLLLAVLHPMAPMALGEALHADCHHVAVLDIKSLVPSHT